MKKIHTSSCNLITNYLNNLSENIAEPDQNRLAWQTCLGYEKVIFLAGKHHKAVPFFQPFKFFAHKYAIYLI
jgi:hypothetical protein